MEILVPIALYGWLPAVMVLLHDIRGHRGLTIAFVVSWLFLPVATIEFSGLPDYTKVTATSFGSLLAALILDLRRVLQFKFRWPDLFVVTYCCAPLFASMANSLGTWDGFSKITTAALIWGVPYFLGRMYFDSFAKLKTLALGIFLGGLIYVPFCLFEIRMSPQLHHWVYGPRSVADNVLVSSLRYNSWRPSVFMNSGLELGMWMTAATLMGFMIWLSGGQEKIRRFRISHLLLVLLATTILCKSTGAIALLLVGMLGVMATRSLRTPAPLLTLALIPVLYLVVRGTGLSDGSGLVGLIANYLSTDRAQSLGFRFQNEELLLARALESPLFGWGGWGRELVYDEYGKVQTIVDGLWIQTLGQYGLVGLTSLYASFLAIPSLTIYRFCRRDWRFREAAPAIGLATFLLLYMIDCLLNAMVNPVYALILGGLTTVTCLPTRQLLGEIGEPTTGETGRHAGRGQLWPRPSGNNDPLAHSSQEALDRSLEDQELLCQDR